MNTTGREAPQIRFLASATRTTVRTRPAIMVPQSESSGFFIDGLLGDAGAPGESKGIRASYTALPAARPESVGL
jgi:hypothetical protein